MPFEMNKLLDAMIQNKASDLHLTVGRPPTVRINGVLRSMGKNDIIQDDMVQLVKSITPEDKMKEIEELGGCDLGIDFSEDARFRVSIFTQRGNLAMVLRIIPNKLLTFDQIGLPSMSTDWLNSEKGMLLVTGPTGSGKSTTLATMIDYINITMAKHIVTVEDPIEFYHKHKKSVVNQREVGADVPDFSEALKRVLRQDPDVILVGEMRDLETISAAITAAETGHLVFGTLHTTGAASTTNRMIDAFPTNQQEQVRAQLATALLGVISQTLVPTIDGKGRVAAFEIMICTPAIQHLIRENQNFKIESVIQTSSKLGMTLMEDSLFNLFVDRKITLDHALAKCLNPDSLKKKIMEWRSKQQMM